MINQCILVIPFSMKPNCKVRVVWAAEELQEVREIVLTIELFLGGCTMDRPAQPHIYLGNRV